jgi:hypothetical protein
MTLSFLMPGVVRAMSGRSLPAVNGMVRRLKSLVLSSSARPVMSRLESCVFAGNTQVHVRELAFDKRAQVRRRSVRSKMVRNTL